MVIGEGRIFSFNECSIPRELSLGQWPSCFRISHFEIRLSLISFHEMNEISVTMQRVSREMRLSVPKGRL